jgi:predicted AlkP superfamily pyrophosphatase or phosphodiesterase
MKQSKFLPVFILVLSLLLLPSRFFAADDNPHFKHVLLISVDGMHALDLTNYVAAHPNSTLAQLSAHGKTYTNASSSLPSDSFPRLAALVTGGSPITAGLWYDVTFNRRLSPPAATNPIMGNQSGACPGRYRH